MRKMSFVVAGVLGAALAGCGDSGTVVDMATGPTPDLTMTANPDLTDPGTGFPQPAGTVAVSFSVDDSINKVYAQGDLQWKGAMIYDPATRKVTSDSTWGGPWAPLYDDGPWNVGKPGGHEPAGSVAGDHKWGVVVFATPPAMGDQGYEYGLIDNVYQTMYGNGWVWQGSNGSFKVSAGKLDPVTAQGLTFTKFGTTDVQLVVDTSQIDMTSAWDTSKVGIKGTFVSWAVQTLTQDAGKSTYTFTLSGVTGSGKPFAHSGLEPSGDKPEFIFVFGSGMTPKEYKDGGGTALATGITASVKASGAGSWTPVTINVNPANKNTSITIP